MNKALLPAAILMGQMSITALAGLDQADQVPVHPTRLLAKLAHQQAQMSPLSLNQHGFGIRRRVSKSREVVVLDRLAGSTAKLSAPQAVRMTDRLAEINALRNSGLFEYVEPDYLRKASLIPTEAAFADGALWALRNVGHGAGHPGADLGTAEAWDVTTGHDDIIVAVIDTGVRYTHQDLRSQMWVNSKEIPGNGLDDDHNGYVDDIHGINAINGSGDPMDENGHGTHVAGIIAAAPSNGGIVGVAWQVQVLACKFMGEAGGYDSDAIEGINYAVQQGARVINASWGGGGFNRALQDAIDAARAQGVLFVAAAGNESTDGDFVPHYPSCYELENVISVAAIDSSDALADFSNYGRRTTHLGAPGVAILSCWNSSDTSFQTLSGTSMAAPFVSGVAVLLLARDPGMAIPELRRRLLDSTVPLSSLQETSVSGGRLNAHRALTLRQDGQLEVSLSLTDGSTVSGGVPARVLVKVTDDSPVANAIITSDVNGRKSGRFTSTAVAGVFEGWFEPSANYTTSVIHESVEITAAVPGFPVVKKILQYRVNPSPANDQFLHRIPVSGRTVTVFGSNQDATEEPGEPGLDGNKSVWWSWTAPINGLVTIDTIGSSFDTVLRVVKGDSAQTAVTLAESDDLGYRILQSRVSFEATAGESYAIAVEGYEGASGSIQLNISLELWPNDGVPTNSPVTIAEVTRAGVRLSFTADGSRSCAIEYSTNLVDWFRLVEIGDAVGTAEYVDASASDRPHCFYRMIRLP